MEDGECVLKACKKGYNPQDNKCVKEESSRVVARRAQNSTADEGGTGGSQGQQEEQQVAQNRRVQQECEDVGGHLYTGGQDYRCECRDNNNDYISTTEPKQNCKKNMTKAECKRAVDNKYHNGFIFLMDSGDDKKHAEKVQKEILQRLNDEYNTPINANKTFECSGKKVKLKAGDVPSAFVKKDCYTENVTAIVRRQLLEQMYKEECQ